LVVLGFIEITYYPFGMISRSVFTSSLGLGYRYSFNGKENDGDVKGDGNQIDYDNRIYDPRSARFLSVDPLQNKFPWWTPYQFAANTPVQAVDLDGKEYKIVTILYSSKSPEPVISVKVIKDLYFDLKTNQARSSKDPGFNLSNVYAKTDVFVYYDKQRVTKQTIPEPAFYPSGLKASANYDYTDEGSERELAKDNWAYQKSRGWGNVINATKNIWDRDHLAPDYYVKNGGFSEMAGLAGIVFLKGKPGGLKYAYKENKCYEFAEEFMNKLGSELGKKGTLRQLEWETNITGGILYDNKIITQNANHTAIEFTTSKGEVYIFDNVNPNGVLKQDYLKKLEVHELQGNGQVHVLQGNNTNRALKSKKDE
jgi:RHS repeat-associated protein